MKRGKEVRWLTQAQILLLLAGSVCFGYLALLGREASAARHKSDRFLAASLEPQAAPQAGGTVSTVRVDPNTSGSHKANVIGRLEIPQLALSVPILSDYQSASLLKGIGHIPGTALPGGLGTLGLAGHRDTYFRPLKGIRKNMDIRVGDEDGVYHYQVDSTEIVQPEQVEVLDIRDRPELTLITCYPFYYIGAAPLRFIVHAHLVSALADPR